MVQVLALEVNAGSASLIRQSLGKVQSRRPPNVVVQNSAELGLKRGVVAGIFVRGGELLDGKHERFGHIPAAVRANTPADVGYSQCRSRRHRNALEVRGKVVVPIPAGEIKRAAARPAPVPQR